MSFTRWLRNVRSALAQGPMERKPRRRSLPAATHRLQLETLEDRCLLSFSPVMNYPAGDYPQAVVAADFNGDSRLDLATANYNNTVSVLLGNADGSFQAARSFVTGVEALSLSVGDFNGDGQFDLATSGGPYSRSPTISVLLGSGDGSFQSPRNESIPAAPGYYPEPGLAYWATTVMAADIDGNGQMDLVVGGAYEYWAYQSGDYEPAVGGYVSVLQGNSDGSFFGQPVYNLASEVKPNKITVADLNGDDRLDLLLLNDVGSQSVVLADPAVAGGFAVGSVLTYYDYAYSVALGDCNGDGRSDLVMSTPGSTSVYAISVRLGDGDGSFQTRLTSESYQLVGSLAVADFNGDGQLDVTLAHTNGVSVLLGRGDGAFSGPNTAAGIHSWAPVIGDFNRDGRPDVAATNAAGVSVLLNDGIWPAADAPSIRITDVTVTEGNAGTRTAVFTVSLSAAYNQTITVGYNTANGTATAGSDYAVHSGTLTLAAGETSKTVTVLVTGDRLGEANETFFVNLGNATNATIADGQGIGTIVDDEPRISISDVQKTEGNGNKTTLFTFTVTLSAAYDVPVTVNFATANGTATTADNDYVATSGTLTFAPGETTKTITVVVKADKKKEANESFNVLLSGASTNVLIADASGLGTILNDD